MSRIQCRGSIVLAALVVALLWSNPVDAQVTNDPGPPREPGGLVNNLLTGVQYDIVNQAKAERRLQQIQAKARCDARDARRIDNLRHRIAVDEWLIRKNSLQDPGCYPHSLRLDPISCAAIADAARPPGVPPTRLAPSRGW